jgi:Cytochrome c
MMSSSRILAVGLLLGTACAAGVVVTVQARAGASSEAASPAAAGNVERGKYLVVAVAACTDCHTPWKMGANGPEPDAARYLSGHPDSMKLGPVPAMDGGWMWAGVGSNTAFAGPWGVSYAINLTPDATGLGQWTEEMFVSAMKTGKHAGVGRPILPPMPWTAYKEMTDDDLKAVFAYLKSIKPVKNTAPAAEVAQH